MKPITEATASMAQAISTLTTNYNTARYTGFKRFSKKPLFIRK